MFELALARKRSVHSCRPLMDRFRISSTDSAMRFARARIECTQSKMPTAMSGTTAGAVNRARNLAGSDTRLGLIRSGVEDSATI